MLGGQVPMGRWGTFRCRCRASSPISHCGTAASISTGHSAPAGMPRRILAAADCRLIGIDRDPAALVGGHALAGVAGGRLVLVEGQFAGLDRIAVDLGVGLVDGIVLDFGVSSTAA